MQVNRHEARNRFDSKRGCSAECTCDPDSGFPMHGTHGGEEGVVPFSFEIPQSTPIGCNRESTGHV